MLAPAESATLAAVMMGLDEPMGDGLSDLELSAVSEAMSQMMGAAANVLADTLGIDIEVSPPVCTVVDDADAARAAFGDSAYCARFRMVSDRITADVLQLVPSDLAVQLHAAFAAGGGTAAASSPSRRPAGRDGDRATHSAGRTGSAGAARARRRCADVRVRVSAELGRARVPVADVMNLPPGAIVELDRAPRRRSTSSSTAGRSPGPARSRGRRVRRRRSCPLEPPTAACASRPTRWPPMAES